MKTIHVKASKNYDVIIGNQLLPGIGAYTAAICKAEKAVIISDSNVWPLFGKIVEASLYTAGFKTIKYVFPAGEANKNGQTYLEILNFLAENKVTRSDVIIALGGGVTGDMAGFCAATYLRGISFVQIPTTLLAMVDSSVGGKTAIDLPAGKNLVGAFYQPSLVLCDTALLDTLPENIFRDGCAEVIKYGVLYDSTLFAHLHQTGTSFDRETVIARCVELKRNVVAEDEYDRGSRQMLNLGHTIGHSIEMQSCFNISHGQAVAMGMGIVATAAAKMEICSTDTKNMLHAILKKFHLETTTHYSAEALFTSALSDKKRSGGTVNLIVPKAIGYCEIMSTPIDKLKSFIEAGL